MAGGRAGARRQLRRGRRCGEDPEVFLRTRTARSVRVHECLVPFSVLLTSLGKTLNPKSYAPDTATLNPAVSSCPTGRLATPIEISFPPRRLSS